VIYTNEDCNNILAILEIMNTLFPMLNLYFNLYYKRLLSSKQKYQLPDSAVYNLLITENERLEYGYTEIHI